MPSPGWVYVLTNPALPGVVKIGQTTHTATRRAVQLAREYGVAAPFEVVSKHAVSNAPAVEAAAHRMLGDVRLPRSELFRCSAGEAARVVKAAALAHAKPWAVTAWLRRPYGFRRARRGSRDGLAALLLIAALAAPVVLLKPDVPSWLPAPVARVALLLERLR